MDLRRGRGPDDLDVPWTTLIQHLQHGCCVPPRRRVRWEGACCRELVGAGGRTGNRQAQAQAPGIAKSKAPSESVKSQRVDEVPKNCVSHLTLQCYEPPQHLNIVQQRIMWAARVRLARYLPASCIMVQTDCLRNRLQVVPLFGSAGPNHRWGRHRCAKLSDYTHPGAEVLHFLSCAVTDLYEYLQVSQAIWRLVQRT